ncbi:MAG: hypothetical protein JWM85_1153 [Acidimicrobiaceae bacterium]|nr:hypothetical protein [Acidimicrobiaceae bacterium]
MSSLWTPGGERHVPAGQGSAPAGGSPGAPRPGGSAPQESAGPGDEQLTPTPEQQAALEELAEMEAELLSVPVEDVVANHCYGLFQLAALHLAQQPPHIEEARLPIDALGLLVNGLDDRLGASAEPLREGLAQIRLAFVQLSSVPGAAATGPDASRPGASGPEEHGNDGPIGGEPTSS